MPPTLCLADHGPAAQRDLADLLPVGVQAQLAQLLRFLVLGLGLVFDVGHVPEAAAGAHAGRHQPREHGGVGPGGALRNHIHAALRFDD